MCKSDILKAFGFQITISNSAGGISTSSTGRRRTQFSGSQTNSNSSDHDHHYTSSSYSSHGHRRTHYHHRDISRTNNLGGFVSNFDNNHIENGDILSVDDENSITSESNTFSFPAVNESHDPFSITQSTSPQLIQVLIFNLYVMLIKKFCIKLDFYKKNCQIFLTF